MPACSRTIFLLGGLATLVAGPAANAVESASAAKIAIEGFAFQPSALSVKAGQKIEFLNKDQMPHSVVGARGAGEEFHSAEAISEGETFSVTVSHPGEIVVHCGLHHGMEAKIMVTQ